MSYLLVWSRCSLFAFGFVGVWTDQEIFHGGCLLKLSHCDFPQLVAFRIFKTLVSSTEPGLVLTSFEWNHCTIGCIINLVCGVQHPVESDRLTLVTKENLFFSFPPTCQVEMLWNDSEPGAGKGTNRFHVGGNSSVFSWLNRALRCSVFHTVTFSCCIVKGNSWCLQWESSRDNSAQWGKLTLSKTLWAAVEEARRWMWTWW